MKVLLVIIVIICCSLIGCGFSKYYISRKNFFSQFELLISSLQIDISFSQQKLVKLIERNKSQITSKELLILCNNYIECLNLKQKATSKIFNSITILKPPEQEMLIIFLNSIGRFDAVSSSKEIEKFKEKFNEFYKEADAESKKYSSLIIKLSIIIGLLICLIII